MLFRNFSKLFALLLLFISTTLSSQIHVVSGINTGPICPSSANGDLVSGDHKFDNAGTLTIDATFQSIRNRVDVFFNIVFQPDNDNTRVELSRLRTVFNSPGTNVLGTKAAGDPFTSISRFRTVRLVDRWAAGGFEFIGCNDGPIDGFTNPFMSVSYIGDTGAEDVSSDNDCGCDAKILNIMLLPFEVHLEEPSRVSIEDFDNEDLLVENVLFNMDLGIDGNRVIADSKRNKENHPNYIWKFERIWPNMNAYQLVHKIEGSRLNHEVNRPLNLRRVTDGTLWTHTTWILEKPSGESRNVFLIKSFEDNKYLQINDGLLTVAPLSDPPYNNNARWVLGRNRLYPHVGAKYVDGLEGIKLKTIPLNIEDFSRRNPYLFNSERKSKDGKLK